jgi:hypothetical protein
MVRRIRLSLIVVGLIIFLASAGKIFLWFGLGGYPAQPTTSTLSPTQLPLAGNITPTDDFANRKNDFGDGYIAHVTIEDVEGLDKEEIVRILVAQWLEHYKTQSTQTDASIKDYTVDEITLVERNVGSDPSIVASIRFSIIPVQIPNIWAVFPGDVVEPDDSWWHLEKLLGVYGEPPNSDYYWLRIMPLG